MKRFLAFLLGGAVAGLVLLAVYSPLVPLPAQVEKWLALLEARSIDYRMRYARQPEASDAIQIVLVNDISALGDTLATFTELLSTANNGAYKPKVIGFNYLFDEPVNESLIMAASTSYNVFYGYNFLLTPQAESTEQSNSQDILPFRLEIGDIGHGVQPVMTAQGVELPASRYLATARGIGFVNTPPDSVDGVFRKVPLFLQYRDNWYGSLALRMAMEFLDIDSVDITFYPGQYFEIVEDSGDFIKVPVNRAGQMIVDFAYADEGEELAPFQTMAMEDVLAQAVGFAELQDVVSPRLEPFRDAIVLVGTSSQISPARLPISLAASYPLLGIHANVINNLLHKQFARDAGMDFTVGLVLLLCMVTGLLIGGFRFFGKIAVTLLIVAGYLLTAYAVFFQFRLLLPIHAPLLALVLTFAAAVAFARPTSARADRPKKAKKTKKARPVESPVVQDKKRKASSDDLSHLEDELLEIREELDRKSFRLRAKVEELRVLQEEDPERYDYGGQIAALQKEIRAREIEVKNLVLKEEELRRQVENLPFADGTAAQFRHDTEGARVVFAKYGFVTHHDGLLYTLCRAEKLAKTSVTILIHGEPGTGKNLLAHIIRDLSTRHNRPLLEVICAGDMDLLEDDLFGHKRGAFPGAEENRNGYFRELDGGTMVLEEIENLSLEIQTRLMQTLRGKVVYPIGDDRGVPVDVRMLATTTQNLRNMVVNGKFREDLYHYFSVFPLYVPPLRDRKEDIPALVTHFVHKYNRVHSKIVETVADEAINVLVTHQWPGNVVELEKVIERAIAEVNPGVKELTEEHLSFEEADRIGGITDAGMLNYLIALMDIEKELPAYQQLRERVLVPIQRMYCARLLRLHRGNIKAAAIDTGLKEDTFKKMLSELMIAADDYRV
jgi:DNA-binding NtrC family response regulator/CHASE2 domain-containing sensor protein